MARLHTQTTIDAEKLRKVRIMRSLSQQATAELAGISYGALSRIENRRTKVVNTLTKQALERVLGADLTLKAGAGGSSEESVKT